jgi:hypothetical protein
MTLFTGFGLMPPEGFLWIIRIGRQCGRPRFSLTCNEGVWLVQRLRKACLKSRGEMVHFDPDDDAAMNEMTVFRLRGAGNLNRRPFLATLSPSGSG